MAEKNSTICFINNFFPSLSETFIYKEVMGLRKRGIPIRTFSIRRPEDDEMSKECFSLRESTTYLLPVNGSRFLKAHLRYIIVKPFLYCRLLGFLLTRKFDRPLKDRTRTLFHFAEGVYLAGLIETDGTIAHIHAHYASHPATLAYVAATLTGIPYSFTAHAHDIWEDRLFLPEKTKSADFVITCSLFGKQALVKTAGMENLGKIRTIYHGVDTKKFSPNGTPKNSNGKPPRILNVGRLTKDKGQDILIEACRALRDEGHSFVCDIVGDGPLRAYLKRLIEEKDLGDTVFLRGKVFQEDIVNYYRSADLFVLSSVQENLPNVLFESLSVGLPVIATMLAGTPELISDRSVGILVEPSDPSALKEAMTSLLIDRERRNALAQNGRQRIRQAFDIERSLDSLHDLYRGILEKRFD